MNAPQPPDQHESAPALHGVRLVFVGKLASMARRDAAQLVRSHGATVVDRADALVHLAVIGEEGLPVPETDGLQEWFDEPTRAAIDRGTLAVVTETQLWQRLGLVEPADELQRLHTPAMLADMLGVPISVVRRWHRRGLIHPVREVRRLPYFDFQEVTTARRLAELLAAGVSPAAIERKLAALAEYLPDVERPLGQLSVIVEGRDILLRQGDGLIEPGGQRRFDFEAAEQPVTEPLAPERPVGEDAVAAGDSATVEAEPAALYTLAELLGHRNGKPPCSPEQLLEAAAELEDDGQLEAAAEMYRAVMAAGCPRTDACFLLAELLYRMGDVSGARERYFVAIELDEDFVEARANLGCVLAELGQHELAIAAFEGTLRFHPDYADVHYHLARTLDEVGRRDEAMRHWQQFLHLAPDSPWAQHARTRVETDR